MLLTLDLNNIEITNNEVGKPSIVLHGALRELAVKSGWQAMHVSLSHIETVATAVVILES